MRLYSTVLKRVMRRHMRIAGWIGVLVLGIANAGGQAETGVMPGPVPAGIVKVIDGDTIRVKARIWLGQEIEIAVRLAGIDAPELNGRCPVERELARESRDRLATIAGEAVQLHDIHYGKYAGRVVAKVTTPAGMDLGARLVADSLARRYDGGRRAAWCSDADPR